MGVGMDRYILKRSLSIIATLLSFIKSGYCLDYVIDLGAIKHLESMGKIATETVGAVEKSVSELQGLNRALGNKIAPGLMSRLSEASTYSQEFSGLMDAFNSPTGDPLSKLNYIGRQHAGTQDCSNYLYAKDYFQRKFFADKQAIPGQKQQVQEIQLKRLDALETSTIDSLAMATHQKRALPHDHQALKDLSAQANADDTIQYQMGVQTRLLEQIAYRLEKLIAIQAQQLELVAAYTTNAQPAVFRQTGGN
jgi:hypothetical protein